MSDNEESKLVQEVENFLIIFALVCLVSWFIRLLCKPFKGIGFQGWFLGFCAIPLLLFALLCEGLSFAYAGTDYIIEEASVRSKVANVRSTPKIANNIVGQLKRGDRLERAQWEGDNWVALLSPKKAAVYMHEATLNIKSKKVMIRNSFDGSLIFAGIFYVLCAVGAWQERKRRDAPVPQVIEKEMELLPPERSKPEVKVVYAIRAVRALPAPRKYYDGPRA